MRRAFELTRPSTGLFSKNLITINQCANTATATVAIKQPGGAEVQGVVVAQYLVRSDGAKGKSSSVPKQDVQV
jgi:hypothetical protein